MGKIYIKGGIWKNTEDEILKAAVMKYGINQWSRISSLLVRKSAKQCKARWYEWLHPSIKKTEWSREEDEKLLHLAKIFPTQWRTIAPVIGRTATQCLDRYEKLLSQAEERDEEASDDPRRLRPGEVDPAPETKPARPDPVDMDDDEKEMLAEARARLANTQGKKAKRKAREKQLEEARRLASLQKKRELKAAGIEVGATRKNNKVIDYNAEIPLYKPAAPGFFDTTEEKSKAPQVRLLGKTVEMIEGKRRSDIEEELRRRDIKRQKEINELPSALNQLADEAQLSKRPKLNLPAPQVSEKELHDIVKVGLSQESVRSQLDDTHASSALLKDYSKLQATPLRTPQTQSSDTLMQEAKNLLALQYAQTPLIGGEQPAVTNTVIDGITPKSSIPATPSRFKSDGSSLTMSRQPSSSLHTKDYFTPRKSIEEEDHRETTRSLLNSLKDLPAPKGQVEIDFDQVQVENEDEEEEQDIANGNQETMIKDVALLEIERLEEQKQLLEIYKRYESQARKRQLALPSGVVVEKERAEMADAMISKEMMILIQRDQQLASDTTSVEQKNALLSSAMNEEKDLDLSKARALILAETKTGLSYEEYLRCREECERELVYLPTKRVFGKALTKAEKLSSLQYQFHHKKEQIMKDAAEAAKIEQKLNILLGGYSQRAQLLRSQMVDIGQSLLETQRNINVLQNAKKV